MELRPTRFLTSVEVAAACGVSPRTVSNWIRDGAIPAHRTVGGHGRISVDDLRTFMTARGIPVPAHLGEPTHRSAPPAPTPAPLADAVAPRRRALVIDDDETLLVVMKEVLAASGYDVETARHGFLAGYLAGHHRPDVILLDILMPAPLRAGPSWSLPGQA